jgi:hypothetical protein
MEIYECDYCNYTVYNPVTDEWVIDTESVCYEAKSLIANWLDDFFNEPFIFDKDLEIAWNAYASGINFDHIDFDDFDRFLREYDNPDWIVFKVTSNPFPGVCNETWLVVDKDCEISEDN